MKVRSLKNKLHCYNDNKNIAVAVTINDNIEPIITSISKVKAIDVINKKGNKKSVVCFYCKIKTI